MTSDGELWHSERHLLTPLFHLKRLRSYFPLMNEEADNLVADLKRFGDDGKKGVTTPPIFARTTLRVIIRAAFGSRLDMEWMIS